MWISGILNIIAEDVFGEYLKRENAFFERSLFESLSLSWRVQLHLTSNTPEADHQGLTGLSLDTPGVNFTTFSKMQYYKIIFYE